MVFLELRREPVVHSRVTAGVAINNFCFFRDVSVLPVIRVPGRERRLLETMQLVIGEFITDSSQGLPPSPSLRGQKAPSHSSLRYLLGTIISWHKWIGYTVGSWCKRIGYTVARQFLLV